MNERYQAIKATLVALMAVLILNYSRSGGTLLSSVLGQLDDVILVSEVNPVCNASSTISTQVKKWYGIDIKANSFKESVIELEAYCLSNKKTLIIRDFSFVDFTPHQFNSFQPALAFSSQKELESVINLRVICFVRDAYDIWISRNFPPQFSLYYLKYLEQIKRLDYPVFKYEDFCKNPDSELQKICKKIGVNFNIKALNSPNEYNNVTGDNQMPKVSRGRKLNDIQVLKRKQIPASFLEKGNADKLLSLANEECGYPASMTIEEFEKNKINWVVELEWRIKKWAGKITFHEY